MKSFVSECGPNLSLSIQSNSGSGPLFLHGTGARTDESTLTSSTTGILESIGNPSLRLCSVVLNGFNYIPWSQGLFSWHLVGGSSKLRYINCKFSSPIDDDPKYEDGLRSTCYVMDLELHDRIIKLLHCSYGRIIEKVRQRIWILYLSSRVSHVI